MSEEIKDIIFDVKDSLNETPKNMYKYNKITLNLNEFEKILNYIEQLENENFNIRENIHLERISLPPELTKDKDFMELYDIPSYKDLQQKVKQLEKENEYLKMSNPEQNMEHFRIVNENKRKIDMLRKENHQLENIRKEAIEYVNKMWLAKLTPGTVSDTKFDLLNILNKGE